MGKKSTYELLLPVFDAIPRTFKGKEIIDLTGGLYKITSCNTLWLTPGYFVTIDSVDYKISEVEPNEYITLICDPIDPAPTVLEFEIYKPFPYQGTIIDQNEQLNDKSVFSDKLPMIWLHEITRERFESDPLSNLERESECDLYFMTEINPSLGLAPQFYKYGVIPMRNLLDSFIETLKESTIITDKNEIKYDQFDHAKFGAYMATKGHERGIFSDYMSGTQLRITIPFAKDLKCCEQC